MDPVKTKHYNVYYDDGFENLIAFLKQSRHYSSIYFLVDENTNKMCMPIINNYIQGLAHYNTIEISSGEHHKNINTCTDVWKALTLKGADRSSLLVNLGGGVLCDIGGFVASTYHRGIDFINIPTTLLAMVDASIGGKTGINLDIFKNQIGCFNNPKGIYIYKDFLKTLGDEEIKSGYGEIFKHALLSQTGLWKHLSQKGFVNPQYLINESICTKNRIVESDPFEKNLRKSLNLGHTIGHALEMLSYKKEMYALKHGHAVAIGLFCMAVISEFHKKLSNALLVDICNFIKTNFDYYPIDNSFYEDIYSIMQHDKKNFSGNIRMVLLKGIGNTLIDCEVEKKDIFAALDFYKDFYLRHHE